MIKMQNAAMRATGEFTKGSAAMRGDMRILPIVIAFGRFIRAELGEGPAARQRQQSAEREGALCQCFEYQFAHGL